MSAKTRRVRAIDIPLQPTPGPALPGDPINAPSEPPALPGVDSPVDVVHSAGLSRTDQGLTGYITVDWDAPPATEPPGYVIQFAEDAGYTTGLITRPTGNATTYTLRELRQGDVRYYRVFAVFGPDWSTPVTGGPVTVPVDTTPPTAPSSVSAAFQLNGSALLTATPASDGRTRRVQFVVQPQTAAGASNGTARTLTSTTGRIEYTVAMNRADTTGGGLSPRVSVSVRAESWAGVLSDPVVVSATKARPATPSGVTADFSARDCTFDWGDVSGATHYLLTIDGVVYTVGASNFTYTLDRNRRDHSGSPAASLSWSLVARDALEQTSATAASGTAANTAPTAVASGTISLDGGGVGQVRVGCSAALPADAAAFVYRLFKDGSPIATRITAADNTTIPITGAGTYQVGVKVYDVFGRVSSETLGASSYIDALSIDDLRADAVYSDDLLTSPNLLAQYLKDGLSGVGITYAASSSWHMTVCARAYNYMLRKVSVVASVANSPRFYISTSADGGLTWRWFAGVASDGYTLSEVANEAAAQTAANNVSALAHSWCQLPAEIEARAVRLHHRNQLAAYRLDEFYPRRRLTLDDLDVEIFQGFVVSANKLIVNQLSALSADMGNITAGTITGALIRTAASGARIEIDSVNGLRGFNSAGVVQAQFDAVDGVFKWGAGVGRAGADGMTIEVTTSGADVRSYAFVKTGAVVGGMRGYSHSTYNTVQLWSRLAGVGNSAQLDAQSDFNKDADVYLRALRQTGLSLLDMYFQIYNGTSSQYFMLAGAPVLIGSGLSGGSAGDVRAAGRVSAGGNSIGSARMTSKGTGTTNSTASFATYNSNDVNTSRIFDNGDMSIAGTLTQNSDADLKHVGARLDDATPVLVGLIATWYAWKDDPAQREHLGFIAQQVEQIAPHLVERDQESGVRRLNQIGIIPYLVRGWQQQHARLQALEARLEKLEAPCCS